MSIWSNAEKYCAMIFHLWKIYEIWQTIVKEIKSKTRRKHWILKSFSMNQFFCVKTLLKMKISSKIVWNQFAHQWFFDNILKFNTF
jgi:hypothetical protein